MSDKRYFGSTNLPSGKVHMGEVKLFEGITCFSDLVKEVIAAPIQQNITRAQYQALSKKEQSDRKKVAYLVPGAYDEDLVPRDGEHIPRIFYLIIIDIDQGKKGNYPAKRFVDDPEQLTIALSPYAFVAYTTASSTTDTPKLRVIVSAASIPTSEYAAAVVFVAGRLGLDEGDYDKVSVEITRAMYRPVIYRGEQADPILAAVPEGQDVTEVDLADVTAPTRQSGGGRKPSRESDDIEFLRAPLEGFTTDDAKDALSHVDADCGYTQWLEICMSLKHQFPREPEATAAFEVFEEWSARAKQKYEGREVTQSKWDAVSTTARGRTPRTIRSLIFLAEESGWSSSVFSKRSFDTVHKWIGDGVRTSADLVAEGLKKIAAAHLESPIEREILIDALQKRLQSFKHNVPKSALKKQLDALLRSVKTQSEPDLTTTPDAQLPAWARGIVYVSDTNEFYQRNTDKTWTPTTLNNTFNVFLAPNQETGKATMEAADFLLNIAKIPRVSNYHYSPTHFDQAIIKHGTKKYVNTYQASYPESDLSDIAAGEVVHNHIRTLIREPEYQRILIDFLAYHVQKPGSKIRWAVVIQGAEGCGKTAIAAVMQGVLGRENAKGINAHTLMDSRFTSWAVGAQLRFVEEIRVVGENRHAVMNKIKPYLTNDEVNVERKGKDEIEAPNCTNYMMFSNHHDALALNDEGRRYFVLQSALQTKVQVVALGPDYFNQLFHAIKFRAPGIRAWLENWQISPEFEPDGRAPATKYLTEMAEAASTPLASAIHEVLEDSNHPLVQKDLISSRTLATLIKQEGLFASASVIGSVLRDKGYIKVGSLKIDQDRHNLWTPQNCIVENWREESVRRHKMVGTEHFQNLLTPKLDDLI
jgi:hypothetical protein